MKYFTTTLFLMVTITLLAMTGCSHKHFIPDTISDANPWTHLNMNDSSGNFQFAIVADRTGHHRLGVFADAIQKINHLQPDFVMCIGDLIEGFSAPAIDLTIQWNEFDEMVQKLEMPFFYLPGNHDIYDANSLQTYNQRRGRPYYHFLYKNVLFLCLSSEETFSLQGSISDKQIDYFASVLKKHPKALWTCVLIHKPIWQNNTSGWQKFAPLLSKRNHTVFAGHGHNYSKQIIPRPGIHQTSSTAISQETTYYQLATTGGTSELKGPQQGNFDHIMWITFNGRSPRIANLSLNAIFGDDPQTESKPKDPKTIATSPK